MRSYLKHKNCWSPKNKNKIKSLEACNTDEDEQQFACDYVKLLPSVSLTDSSSVSLLFENMHKFPAVLHFSLSYLWIVISASFPTLSHISCIQVFFIYLFFKSAYGWTFLMNNPNKPIGVFLSLTHTLHFHTLFSQFSIYLRNFFLFLPTLQSLASVQMTL